MKSAAFSSMHTWSISAAWAFTLGHNHLGVIASIMTLVLLVSNVVRE